MVERLAEQVVKHPEVQLARQHDRVDLAVGHQTACAPVVAQVDEQLRFRDLRRDMEVDLGDRRRGILYRDRLAVLVRLRFLLFPVFQRLPVFFLGTPRFRLDHLRIAVGQVAHVVDAPLTVGSRSHLDREQVRVDTLAMIDAEHLRQAGAQHRAGSEERHVAFAPLGIEGRSFAEQRREQPVQLFGQERGLFAEPLA